jgi:hypothetical protein
VKAANSVHQLKDSESIPETETTDEPLQKQEPDLEESQLLHDFQNELMYIKELRNNALHCWQRATSIQASDDIFLTCPLLHIFHRVQSMYSLYEISTIGKPQESDMYRQGCIKYLDDLISQQKQNITTQELPIILESEDLQELEQLQEHMKKRFATTKDDHDTAEPRLHPPGETTVHVPEL